MVATEAPAPRVAHPVGSRSWEAVLRTLRMIDDLLERKCAERLASANAHPHDADLARRVDVLARELSFSLARTDHFARTGAVLAHPSEGVPDPRTRYLCPVCRATDDAPGRGLRAEVALHSPHFGARIPCPRCQPDAYAAYVRRAGQPPGFPVTRGGAS